MTIQISYDLRIVGEEEFRKHVIDRYDSVLQEIADHCKNMEERNTASDYGEKDLSDEEIEDIESMFSFD